LFKVTKDGARLAFPSDTAPTIQLFGSAFLDSGFTMQGLRMPTAGGDTVRWQVAKRFNILTKPTLRGTARNFWLSSSANSRDTIDLPARDTLHNFYIRDQVFLDSVRCARSDTCTSGGGNY
jgi:hypothetical protein